MILDQDTVASAAEIMQSSDLSQHISTTDDHFEIDDGLYEEWIKKLEASGMEGGEYLYKDSKYLKAIIKAELASTYPKLKNEKTNLSDNKFQGTVEIIRRTYEAEDDERYTKANKKDDPEILLTYMKPEEFNSKLAALKTESNYEQLKSDYEELRRYFTIKGNEQTTENNNTTKSNSGITIVIPLFDGTSVSAQEISYQNNINKYSVPVEFLVSQLQVTQNPEYIYSLADMVINNSKIELVIQETYSYSYTRTVVNEEQEVTEADSADGTPVTTTKIVNVSDTKSETETIGIMKYIREVDTWIVKVTQEYEKTDTRYQESGAIKFDEAGTFTYTKTGNVSYSATPAVSNNE